MVLRCRRWRGCPEHNFENQRSAQCVDGHPRERTRLYAARCVTCCFASQADGKEKDAEAAQRRASTTIGGSAECAPVITGPMTAQPQPGSSANATGLRSLDLMNILHQLRRACFACSPRGRIIYERLYSRRLTINSHVINPCRTYSSRSARCRRRYVLRCRSRQVESR